MLKILIIAAWLVFAADAFLVGAAIVTRDMGDDAAGRGLALGWSLIGLVFVAAGGAALFFAGRAQSWLGVGGSMFVLAMPLLLFSGSDVESWFHNIGVGISNRKYEKEMLAYPEPAQRELALAIEIGDVAEMQKVLATHPNLNGRNAARYDLLSRAISLTAGSGPDGKSAQRVEAVRLLLEAGMDPNQSHDPDGHSPVAMVSYRFDDPPCAEVFRLLLDRGADPNGLDASKRPVIFDACQNLDNVRALLDRGANIEIRDSEGNSPLLFYVWNGRWDAAALMLDRGVNIDVVNQQGTTLEIGIENQTSMANTLRETLPPSFEKVRTEIARRRARNLPAR